MIIIHPYSRSLNNGKRNPKDYPYWEEVIFAIQSDKQQIIQIGEPKETPLVGNIVTIPLKEIKKLVRECDTWISVDSFFQHLAWREGKRGIVLFGPSDPKIFGHSENINLYADRKYFRPHQFQTWEECDYNENAFVTPEKVIEVTRSFYK